jgi:hypothetical protein
MSLDVSPWTGNNQEVSGQFADDCLDLLMVGLCQRHVQGWDEAFVP